MHQPGGRQSRQACPPRHLPRGEVPMYHCDACAGMVMSRCCRMNRASALQSLTDRDVSTDGAGVQWTVGVTD
jgi:hypothetical protein